MSPNVTFAKLHPTFLSELTLTCRCFGIVGKNNPKCLKKCASLSANESSSLNYKWWPTMKAAILLRASTNRSSSFNWNCLPILGSAIVYFPKGDIWILPDRPPRCTVECSLADCVQCLIVSHGYWVGHLRKLCSSQHYSNQPLTASDIQDKLPVLLRKPHFQIKSPNIVIS